MPFFFLLLLSAFFHLLLPFRNHESFCHHYYGKPLSFSLSHFQIQTQSPQLYNTCFLSLVGAQKINSIISPPNPPFDCVSGSFLYFFPLTILNMCNINSSESIPSNSFCRKRAPKRHNIRVRRLNRWRRLRKRAGTKKMTIDIKTDMQMKNLKLYMENQSIIEENERLRKKALLLHQENQTLFAQLQNKLSNPQNHF